MKRSIVILTLFLVPGWIFSADEAPPRPDRIEVAGGAVLVGEIQTVEAGAIQLKTDYAGLITVNIDKVERLDLGTTRELGLPRELLVARTDTQKEPEKRDAPKEKMGVPAVVDSDLPKGWNMEAGLDLNGKTGNSERFDLRLTVEAELEREFDRTNLYGRYAYGTNRGVRSASEIIGGGKYTNFLLDRTGIFVRGELEQDDFEGILVRSTAAVGFTYQIRKEKDLRIEARTGVSHRYEDYIDDGEESFPGMDLGLDVTWEFVKWARFKGTYTLVPSVDDMNDFIFEQDTGFNLPLDQGEFWKLRFGVTSQYNNEPDVGREKLDARYYARLIATWF